jgi:diguanylate cyclase (GGDEF)-like protein/PAS domain S-box-containing protein
MTVDSPTSRRLSFDADGTPSSRAIQERLSDQRRLLARMMRSDALTRGDISAALRQVTELAADLLRVERASVWRFDGLHSTLECVESYERSLRRHGRGESLSATRVPRYFDALEQDRCVAAHDAKRDPRTAEFTSWYLDPHGIGAMLDAPVFVRGHMVGVVCHEHVGPARRWEFWEELLAGTMADFVALVTEASERLRAERELGFYQDHLQQLVELRTVDLDRVNGELSHDVERWRLLAAESRERAQHLRDMLHASPVPVVVANLDSTEIRYSNQRADALFGAGAGSLGAGQLLSFYSDADERETFRAELRASGRIDGFVVRLKGHDGRQRFAVVSAETIEYEGEQCLMVGFSDITPQKLAEQAVRKSEQNVRALFEAAPVALVLSRVGDNTVIMANHRAADLFEIPLTEVEGQRTPDFYVDLTERQRMLAILTAEGHVENFAVRMRTRTGREFWAMLSNRILEFEGEVSVMAGLVDISAEKQLEEQLRELATRDYLTHAYNRRHFMDVAAAEIERARRHATPVSVCMLDCDRFKDVNDRHGHGTGDRVLRLLADTARRALRSSDILARFGGEEFVLLLPHTALTGARDVAERIRSELDGVGIPLESGALLHLTISGGVAELGPTDDLTSLLRRADAAMYEAKGRGRNRIVVDDASAPAQESSAV